jgi:hypothetical protein
MEEYQRPKQLTKSNVKCLEEQNSQEEKATEKQLSLEKWIHSQKEWIVHQEEQALDPTEWRIRQRVQELFQEQQHWRKEQSTAPEQNIRGISK